MPQVLLWKLLLREPCVQLLVLPVWAVTDTLPQMKFGNRGHNIPCTDQLSGRCYITSQNHGYQVLASSLPAHKGWGELFVNANDGSIEGLRASPESGKLVWAAQFHPESAGGPQDSHGMFTDYVDEVVKLRKEEGRSVGKGLSKELLVQAPRSATGTPIGDIVSPSTANVVSPR